MDTQITFVLDSSGSMSKIAEDTRGGFNEFLEEQREEEGTATVSLYNFDSDVTLVYENKMIEDAPKLDEENYRPGGSTALHDALAKAIDDTIDNIEMRGGGPPDNVIVVALTDGKENASETPEEAVRERVEDCREDRGWEFLFIGAKQDAALTAKKMGMDEDRSLDLDHSGEGARSSMQSTSRSVSQARRTGDTGGFDDEDRRQQREASSEDTSESS
jgi:Mg-chelatase subunit ChlD